MAEKGRKWLTFCRPTAEAELAKLQRQYRAAEGGRKAYSDETQATLRKQVGETLLCCSFASSQVTLCSLFLSLFFFSLSLCAARVD
jgi:hypothetical protein